MLAVMPAGLGTAYSPGCSSAIDFSIAAADLILLGSSVHRSQSRAGVPWRPYLK